jgi:hypothetical protein
MECIWLGACSFAVLIDWWTNSAVDKRYRINQFTWIKFVVLCYKVVLLNCCCVNRFSLHILLCHNFCPVLPGPKHTPVLIKFSDQKRYFNLAQGSLSWTSLCWPIFVCNTPCCSPDCLSPLKQFHQTLKILTMSQMQIVPSIVAFFVFYRNLFCSNVCFCLEMPVNQCKSTFT